MERLTKWFGYGDCRVAGIASHLEEKHTAEELVDILATRLAAYEDTGLTPEDLRSNVDIDYVRIVELLKAEAEDRLVVLPCKVGDIVYGAETSPVIPLHVFEYAVYLESAEGGDFEVVSNFGKTVFLTREEAEAALKGGAHE